MFKNEVYDFAVVLAWDLYYNSKLPILFHSFPILIVKHQEQEDVDVQNLKWNFYLGNCKLYPKVGGV